MKAAARCAGGCGYELSSHCHTCPYCEKKFCNLCVYLHVHPELIRLPLIGDGQKGVNTGAGIFLRPDGAWGQQGDWWTGEAQAMDKIGKKAAGRLLDGREWSEYPGVTCG